MQPFEGSEQLLFELTQPRGIAIVLGTLSIVLIALHVGLQLAAVRRLHRLARLRGIDPAIPTGGRASVAAAERVAALEERVRRLTDEHRDLDELLQELPLCCVVLDGVGRVRRINAEAVKLLGRTGAELIGHSLSDLCTPAGGASGPSLDGHLACIEPPGGRKQWVIWHCRDLRHVDGTTRTEIWVAQAATDPTAEVQDAGRSSADVALEAMGRLAGNVAHDFNNHLTAILGHASLMEEGLRRAGMSPYSAEEICRATEQARGLTQNLLAFSRRQATQPEAIDVGGLLSTECVGELRDALASVRNGSCLELSAPPNVGYVRADASQLREVLRILAINAGEAMGESGGTLRVDAACVTKLPDGAIGGIEAGAHPGPWVRIRFADSGTGMEPEVIEHAFEPFFTTKGRGLGAGLGLSTVYGFVTRYGGRIAVSNRPAGGAQVDLFFPSIGAIVKADAGTSEGEGVGRTICVVDDDPRVRRTVTRVLSDVGYRVIPTGGGKEAMSVCDAIAIDLVLTDVLMPEMTGTQLRDELAARHRETNVVFMSGDTGGDSVHAAIGDTPVLQKPFVNAALREHVRRALQGADAAAKPIMRVLIVDDEEIIRDVIILLLANLDFECHVARDGMEALERLEQRRYDVVLCDMVMPKKDGIELCREIRTRFPDVGVVAMSGNVAGSASLPAASVLGACATLGKPFSRKELVAALGRAAAA